MSCEHEVRFTIKPTDDACRFHFDVRAYKDRIVAPDEYSGATEVTPSHVEQVLPTTDKLVRDDIIVNPAPTEILSTDHNGTFTPSDGHVGFYQVDVDVQPDLRPLSVTENGSYQPDGFDGYNRVSVDVPDKVLISESVLAENKLTENIHQKYWIDNYLPVPAEQDPNRLYLIKFENNNAQNYRVVSILSPALVGNSQPNCKICVVHRLDNGTLTRYDTDYSSATHQRTCEASIGTVIKVYKLRYAF